MLTFLLSLFGTIFITIAAINLLLSWWLRNLLSSTKTRYSGSQKSQQQHRSSTNHYRQDSETSIPEKMVSCAYCHTYLPIADSVERDGRFFCHREHLELFEEQ